MLNAFVIIDLCFDFQNCFLISLGILRFLECVVQCLCQCVCCCICYYLLYIIILFVFGSLMSYGVSMDEPGMIPVTELPRRYSKNLPRVRNIFVGRENETQQLLDYLHFNNSNVRIVGIFGGPGFGKSTLAIQASHRLASTNITIEYYDLSEVSFVPYLLHRILRISTNISERTAILEELKIWADTIVIDTILVFDGCDILFSGSQKGELQNLIEILVEHSDNIKILLTSRYRVSFLTEFKSIKLNELKPKDATTLLKRLTSGASVKSLRKIAVLVGSVPLALQVVGALLEMDRMTPKQIVFELSRDPIKILSSNGLPVGTSLTLSYNSLDEFTQRCGRYLANFPGSFSEDAAFGVLAYMVNKTYWYARPFQELNVFLHWIPKPSACLDNLVHHSLLKFNPTLQRYSFHKLIQDFFLHSQAEEMEVEREKRIFKLGFCYYFTIYWGSLSHSVKNHDDEFSILAAIDLNRHNFELMQTFLSELGLNTSYNDVITNTEILVTGNFESVVNYYRHLKLNNICEINIMVEDMVKQRLEAYKLSIFIWESKIAVQEIGPQKYLKIFVLLMWQKSVCEEYLFNTKRALETLKSRKHRVMEIYKEYGNTVSDSVDKYYQYILKYSLDTGDIDIYMEAFQKLIMLKSEAIILRKEGSEQRKGLIEFGAENYKKAKKHFKQHLKQAGHDYLYTMMFLYYCNVFSGEEDEATKIVEDLDTDINRVRVYEFSVLIKDVKVLSMFYAKVRPGSPEHEILTLKLKHTILEEELEIEDECPSDDESCS